MNKANVETQYQIKLEQINQFNILKVKFAVNKINLQKV